MNYPLPNDEKHLYPSILQYTSDNSSTCNSSTKKEIDENELEEKIGDIIFNPDDFNNYDYENSFYIESHQSVIGNNNSNSKSTIFIVENSQSSSETINSKSEKRRHDNNKRGIFRELGSIILKNYLPKVKFLSLQNFITNLRKKISDIDINCNDNYYHLHCNEKIDLRKTKLLKEKFLFKIYHQIAQKDDIYMKVKENSLRKRLYEEKLFVQYYEELFKVKFEG